MKNQVLTISQMQELIDMGIDTSNASAFYYPQYGEYYEHPITKKYVHDIKGYNSYPSFVNGDRTLKDLNPDLFPGFTLQDMLEMLSQGSLRGSLHFNKNKFIVLMADNQFNVINETDSVSSIEAVFKMLKWCKQNNYI